MFFTLVFGDDFFFYLILANCVCDESCGEKFAPISPRGPKFVAQIDFCAQNDYACSESNMSMIVKGTEAEISHDAPSYSLMHVLLNRQFRNDPTSLTHGRIRRDFEYN